MSEFYTRNKNEIGEYEITFKTANKNEYAVVQDVCRVLIDKKRIDFIETENARLKEILKQVADDIEKFRIEFKENNCRTSCEKCLFYNDGKDECVYKHMDEIKKMIDGDVNE